MSFNSVTIKEVHEINWENIITIDDIILIMKTLLGNSIIHIDKDKPGKYFELIQGGLLKEVK